MAIPVIESISEDAEVDVADETSTLTQPTSLATGEWIFPIIAIEADDVATSPFDDSTNKPTGCDLIDDFGLGDNTDVWAAVYSRLVTGGESWPLAVAWAETAAMVDFCGITLRVSGVNDSNPVNIVGTPATYTSADTKTASSITTTEDDCLGVALIIFDGADGSPISLDAGSVSAGWSIAAEHVSNTGAVGVILAVATKEQASAGALGDCTFTPAVSDGAAVIMFAIEGDSATTEITYVDTDETIEDGQQNVSVTVSGFSTDINQIELHSGSFQFNGLFDSGTGTSYTFDLPDISEDTRGINAVPFTSSNHSISVFVSTAESGEASLPITFNPKTGWARIDVVSGSIAEGSIFEDRAGGAPADTSQVYYPTASNTSITAAGLISTDLGTVNGKLFNISTGEWESWTWTVAASLSNGLSFSKFILSLDGYTGSIADRAIQYLTDQGFTTGSLTDKKMAWLGSLGYTGSLNDRLSQWINA